MTPKPRSANSSTVARPMPLAAPVTMTDEIDTRFSYRGAATVSTKEDFRVPRARPVFEQQLIVSL
jgi:hypothetical protein